MEIKFETAWAFKDMAEKFLKTYQIVSVYNCTVDNRNQLKQKTDRKCRYCGLSMPKVTFRNDAHMIPEMLGNKTFISDFECDSCNATFSKYDDSFAKLLEPQRTLFEIKGKENKIPTFKPINGNIRMEVKDFFGKNSLSISRPVNDFKTFTLNEENGTLDINFDMSTFSPEKAYKFLLKIALSLIPAKEVESDYKEALRFLLNKTTNKLHGGIVSGYYVNPMKFNTQVFLFKKVDQSQSTFTHFIALYTLNRIFTLPVTLNKNDFWFYGKAVEAINYPPLFVGRSVDFEKLNIKPFSGIMSIGDKAKGKQTISLPIKTKKWVHIDPETDQILEGSEVDLNADDIMQISFVEVKDTPI